MNEDERSRFVLEENQFTIKPKAQKTNEGNSGATTADDKKKPKAQKVKPDDESNEE